MGWFSKQYIIVKVDYGVPKYYTNSGMWSLARDDARVFSNRSEALTISYAFADHRVNIQETVK